MANIQIQKPQTITTTVITQQQSQEIVQMIVHGGLSTISYLRGFFAEKAFVQRIYGEDGILPSYVRYAAGDIPVERRSARQITGGVKMQLLQRGKSRRVDMLLDWLEHGAFPAMESGNLRAIQVFVHADPEDRSRIIETYTFTVKYIRDADNHHVAAGIEVGRAGSHTISVGGTSRALQELVLRIDKLCGHLPHLPAQRYVSMEILYNENGRIPDGWMPATSDKLFLGEAEGWTRHDESFEGIDSKFHETAFQVSYLTLASNTGLADPDPSTIPDRLEYTRTRPVLSDVGTEASIVDITEDAAYRDLDEVVGAFAATPSLEQPVLSTAASAVESVPTQSLADHENSRGWEARIPSRRLSITKNMVGFNETQSSNVIEMRDAFLAMMQPETITQGDTQTQAQLHERRRAASVTTASPSRCGSSPSAQHRGEDAAGETSIELSQSTVARLDREKAKHTGRPNTTSKGRKEKSQGVTACVCGCTEDEDHMITCNYCERLQHLHCYGFTGHDDARSPEKFVCYQCLLSNSEQDVLDMLYKLVQKRRAMHQFMQGTAKKTSDVAVSLQLAVSDIEPMVSELQEAGYIVAKKAGRKSSSSKLAYNAVEGGPNYERMMRELFDPLSLIRHHYQSPQVGNEPSTNSRSMDMSAIQMPPPATPASRWMRSSRPPRSGSDLSAMESPLKIASRAGGRRSSGVKRSCADSAAHVLNSSRVKRVQTQFLLDANGLSSSPAPSATD